MDERARRIAQNEAVARIANEKMGDLNETFSMFSGRFVIVCECGDGNCVEEIELNVEEYAQVRSDPLQFAVVPGHELETVESVVATSGSHHVVRKHEGAGAAVARATDRT